MMRGGSSVILLLKKEISNWKKFILTDKQAGKLVSDKPLKKKEHKYSVQIISIRAHNPHF